MRANPIALERAPRTKKSAARDKQPDNVFIPNWQELAELAKAPERLEDRLLITTMAWTGLRFQEALSLYYSDLWQQRNTVDVVRVWVRGPDGWVCEDVKQGRANSVYLPMGLWRRLNALATKRSEQDASGSKLAPLLFIEESPRFFLPNNLRANQQPIFPAGIIDQSNWRRNVWVPARDAAGLGPNRRRTELDPRRHGLKVKDLRATFASFLLDAGATDVESAAALRHSTTVVTKQHYLRPVGEAGHDGGRSSLRLDFALPITRRIDRLWDMWITETPGLAEALGLEPTGQSAGQLQRAKRKR